MRRRITRRVLSLAVLAVASGARAAPAPKVELVKHEAEHRVDVVVDKQPFTSYLWSDDVKKPVLFPVRDAMGAVVTRWFPLEPRPGESHDHPHHAGFWLTYGDVDGVDYWGNHKDAKGSAKHKLGTIVHKAIGAARGGAGKGELEVESAWINDEEKPVLREKTRYVFAASDGRRAIDRIARLEALAPTVSFLDNKEGMLGLRLAKELEQPGKKNPEATGLYRSSEGKTGDAVWGTRARWVMLTGKLAGAPVTVALLDHPTNPGFPTHWHARGYGLFAANPMGAKSLGGGKEKEKEEGESGAAATPSLTLAKGKAARFAYRLVILSSEATPEAVEAEYQRFVREVK
jgi:hypothetical protein